MLCKNCNEEVSAKFIHSILQNICPACGEQIIDPKLKDILNNLKIAMDEAKEFPEQVEDWLLSNYNFKKYNPDDEPMFPAMRQQIKGSKKISRSDEDDIDNAQINEHNAGMTKQPSPRRLRSLVDQIQGETHLQEDLSGIDPVNMIINDENVAPLDVRGRMELDDLFENSKENGVSAVLEADKLRKLRNRMAGAGNINRKD